MTMAFALRREAPPRSRKLRVRTRAAIMLARPLARLRPDRLRRVLDALARGARPATVAQASAARRLVLAQSLPLNGLKACLPRSVACVLLCRFHGVWPTWCVGVRVAPPFGAHAWIEVGETMIGENGTHSGYARLVTVPPAA